MTLYTHIASMHRGNMCYTVTLTIKTTKLKHISIFWIIFEKFIIYHLPLCNCMLTINSGDKWWIHRSLSLSINYTCFLSLLFEDFLLWNPFPLFVLIQVPLSLNLLLFFKFHICKKKLWTYTVVSAVYCVCIYSVYYIHVNFRFLF